MAKKIRYFVWLILLLLPTVGAQAKVSYFEYPDPKESYCGSSISVFYCQCAFHGKNCGAVNTSQGAAWKKVDAGFKEYVGRQIWLFGLRCTQDGGIYHVMRQQCEHCDSGKVPSEGVCINSDDKRSLEEEFNLPKIDSKVGGRDIGYVDAAEGEFFVYSPGRGKWIGPVKRGLTLYEGDVLYTTENGRAKIQVGNENMYVLERTKLILPVPQRPRSVLERGALAIWNSIKRLATNTPYEIEGGAHSITGIKGTKFLMEVDDDGNATYTLNEGAIDVWRKEDPSSKTELKPGESAKVTAAGVERVAYEWDGALKKRDVAAKDFAEPVELPKNLTPIDPDRVVPSEAAYSGDLVGDGAARAKIPGRGTWKWILALALIVGAAFFVKKNPATFKLANLQKNKYFARAYELVNTFIKRLKK